jgi:hypothetical protein
LLYSLTNVKFESLKSISEMHILRNIYVYITMEIRARRAVNQSFSTTKSVFLNIIFQIKWEPVNFFISILVPNLLVPLSTPLLLFNLNMDQNKNFITTTLFILKYYIPDKMRTSQPNLLVPLSTPLLIFILNKDQSKKKYWGKVTHDSFLVTLDTY